LTKRSTLLAAALAGLVALSTVAGLGTAHAAPSTPAFGPAIDGYAAYDPQTTCVSTAQPGVVDFRDLLNATYGTHTSGIVRACGVGDTSEHKEGRALDYSLSVTNDGERAVADDVLGWLLATDQHGNPHAMARRLGLMYIIWNHRIWASYRASEGWRPYSCDGTASGCHTNHIHFSFGWPGALRQTTWWTAGSAAYHQLRRPDGGWTGFAPIGPSGVTGMADAVDSAGNTHVLSISGGQLGHRIRFADSSWTPVGPVGNPGSATSVTAAVGGEADLHVAVVAGGAILHRVRSGASGAWTPWGAVGNPPGPVTAVAGAFDTTRGLLHLLAVANGQTAHRVRFADGSWGPWGPLGNPGSASAISAASTANGDLHVVVVAGGVVLHRIRSAADGAWTPWGGVGNPAGPVTAVAGSADRASGVLHLAAVANGQVVHRVRQTDGSWSPWGLVGNPRSALALGVATTPGGDLQVVVAA